MLGKHPNLKLIKIAGDAHDFFFFFFNFFPSVFCISWQVRHVGSKLTWPGSPSGVIYMCLLLPPFNQSLTNNISQSRFPGLHLVHRSKSFESLVKETLKRAIALA